MPDRWDRLTSYTSAHHGVVGLQAAARLGLSRDHLKTFERADRLIRCAPGVWVVTGSPSSWRQRVMVATASSSAWASHRTAAALWGLDGFPHRQVEVLSPYGRERVRHDWQVHRTRRLRGVDLTEVYGIPCTAVVRTILDLAAVVQPFQVSQALDHACRLWPGLLDLVVQRFLELAGKGRKGTRVMRELLEERLGTGRFCQSGFEASTRRLVRAVGLPDPIPQHLVQDGDFKAYLDLAWPDMCLGLECDSLAWHTGKRAHEWDRMRRRRLKSLGWDLIEVTYDDVTKRRAKTGAQIRDLYNARRKALM